MRGRNPIGFRPRFLWSGVGVPDFIIFDIVLNRLRLGKLGTSARFLSAFTIFAEDGRRFGNLCVQARTIALTFHYLCRMKNIVFDLGGVVFGRDPRKWEPEFMEFFAFIHAEKMPEFWVDYDRGTLTLDEVVRILSREKACDERVTARFIRDAIDRQEEIVETRALVGDLKRVGYKLYVLSNMSREFIDFLRKMPVYRCFDGEVISCEEQVVKPEPEIYRRLLDRYSLDPADTLFIDDRPVNLEAARTFGISTFLFRHREAQRSCDELRKMLL